MGAGILIVIREYLPSIGGSQIQASHLARALARQGLRVEVVTARLRREWPRREVEEGVIVHRLSSPKIRLLGTLWYLLHLTLFLFKRRKDFQIIHAFMFKESAIAAAILGKVLGKKVLVRPACAGSFGDVTFLRRKRQSGWPGQIYYISARLAQRLTDAFIAISKEIKRELTRFGVPQKKIYLIPSSIPIPKILVPRDEARRALSLSRFPVVLFVGRLSAQKGLKFLLSSWGEVLKEFPQAQLVILGDGGERERLLAQAKESNLAGSVEFKGEVKNVPLFLAAADIFVLPSLAEGMSASLLEAMASGLAAIATRVSGSVEIITSGQNGILVEPQDVQGLGQAIRGLLADEALRERLSIAARKTIQERFSLEEMVERHMQLYGELLGRSP